MPPHRDCEGLKRQQRRQLGKAEANIPSEVVDSHLASCTLECSDKVVCSVDGIVSLRSSESSRSKLC